MTRYSYKKPVSPDLSRPWIQGRLEQVRTHFQSFLTSQEGRFYVLFGGRRSGKTSLLQTIHEQFPPKPGEKLLSIFVDLATADVLFSSKGFFKLLFEEIRRQLGICYIDPQEEAQLFQETDRALPDFKKAFSYVAWSPESQVQGSRFVLLLDNADKVAQEPFVSIKRAFLDVDYIKAVTSKLDIVVTGGAPLYGQLAEVKLPDKLKNWYKIETLPTDAARALIADLPALEHQPDLIGKVLEYTGRHPYLLQYFMAQLETRATADQSLNEADLQETAAACLQPRGEIGRWFYECSQTIEDQGAQAVCAALTTGQKMNWSQIEATIQERGLGDAAELQAPAAFDRALDTLIYHGFVEHKRAAGTDHYALTCELFKQWFAERVVSTLEEGAAEQKRVTQWVQILTERFDREELRTLCYKLGVEYDDLPAEGRANKARELVRYLERRDRVPELVKAIKQLRPDVSWDEMPQVT